MNLVTTDPVRLQAFYALALRTESLEIAPGRWELRAGEATLVITRTQTKTPVNPDSCGVEFEVDDVDAEYRRLRDAGVAALSAGDLPVGLARDRFSRSRRQPDRLRAVRGNRM